MMTDPVADLLNRIRIAGANGAPRIAVPRSREKEAIVATLVREGFLRGYRALDDGKAGKLEVELKYGPEGRRVFHHVRRASKPGRRLYRGLDRIRPVQGGLGLAVFHTSRGVLSDRECRKNRVGGEWICSIW
jgi:small subunit ribosomal protein S8